MTIVIEYKYRSTMYANTNPEYREKARAWAREGAARLKAKYPQAFRKKQNAYLKNRYDTDLEYREKKLAYNREYREKKKAEAMTITPSLP
jgi:hypothetical protein